MATTTNYGWETPDDTDLVKDGAAAIRTLGSSIDTTTKNLNPETTLGDIAYRSSTANTNTRLAIGSNGQVLTVASGVPSWATASSGALTLISQASFDATSVSVSNCFSTTYENYLILINCSINNATPRQTFFRFLDSGGSEYSADYYGSVFGYRTTGTTLQQTQSDAAAQINFPVMSGGTSQASYFAIQVQRRGSTNGAYATFTGTLFTPVDSQRASFTIGGGHEGGGTIYGFKFYNGTFNVAGNYRVYGYQKS